MELDSILCFRKIDRRKSLLAHESTRKIPYYNDTKSQNIYIYRGIQPIKNFEI